jgi:hypothetical protein
MGESSAFGYELYCLESSDLVGYIGLSVLMWVSQTITMARITWNSKSTLLALDEALFHQSSYNSILLEQYVVTFA